MRWILVLLLVATSVEAYDPVSQSNVARAQREAREAREAAERAESEVRRLRNEAQKRALDEDLRRAADARTRREDFERTHVWPKNTPWCRDELRRRGIVYVAGNQCRQEGSARYVECPPCSIDSANRLPSNASAGSSPTPVSPVSKPLPVIGKECRDSLAARGYRVVAGNACQAPGGVYLDCPACP